MKSLTFSRSRSFQTCWMNSSTISTSGRKSSGRGPLSPAAITSGWAGSVKLPT